MVFSRSKITPSQGADGREALTPAGGRELPPMPGSETFGEFGVVLGMKYMPGIPWDTPHFFLAIFKKWK